MVIIFLIRVAVLSKSAFSTYFCLCKSLVLTHIGKKICFQRVSGKFPPENCRLWKYPPSPYEYSPLWKLPTVKITAQKIVHWENSHLGNYPQWNPLPAYKSYKRKEKQNFLPWKSCAIQHPYHNNQGSLWYTDDPTENTGLLLQNEKNPKIERKRKSPSGIYLPVVQVKEN